MKSSADHIDLQHAAHLSDVINTIAPTVPGMPAREFLSLCDLVVVMKLEAYQRGLSDRGPLDIEAEGINARTQAMIEIATVSRPFQEAA